MHQEVLHNRAEREGWEEIERADEAAVVMVIADGFSLPREAPAGG